MDRCREYDRPLCLAFVDYEKALDSVEHWAVFYSLHCCGIYKRSVNIRVDYVELKLRHDQTWCETR